MHARARMVLQPVDRDSYSGWLAGRAEDALIAVGR